MERASLIEDLVYSEDKPIVTVLLKTKTVKELRILMKAGQVMKEHKAAFPIIVEVFEGAIDFGVNRKKQLLKKGDLIALDANVPHDLCSVKESIIRLTVLITNSK